MEIKSTLGERLLQAAIEGDKTRKKVMETEDLIVLCEEAISNLEDVPGYLVELGD
jgi:hypothetical protein